MGASDHGNERDQKQRVRLKAKPGPRKTGSIPSQGGPARALLDVALVRSVSQGRQDDLTRPLGTRHPTPSEGRICIRAARAGLAQSSGQMRRGRRTLPRQRPTITEREALGRGASSSRALVRSSGPWSRRCIRKRKCKRRLHQLDVLPPLLHQTPFAREAIQNLENVILQIAPTEARRLGQSLPAAIGEQLGFYSLHVRRGAIPDGPVLRNVGQIGDGPVLREGSKKLPSTGPNEGNDN